MEGKTCCKGADGETCHKDPGYGMLSSMRMEFCCRHGRVQAAKTADTCVKVTQEIKRRRLAAMPSPDTQNWAASHRVSLTSIDTASSGEESSGEEEEEIRICPMCLTNVLKTHPRTLVQGVGHVHNACTENSLAATRLMHYLDVDDRHAISLRMLEVSDPINVVQGEERPFAYFDPRGRLIAENFISMSFAPTLPNGVPSCQIEQGRLMTRNGCYELNIVVAVSKLWQQWDLVLPDTNQQIELASSKAAGQYMAILDANGCCSSAMAADHQAFGCADETHGCHSVFQRLGSFFKLPIKLQCALLSAVYILEMRKLVDKELLDSLVGDPSRERAGGSETKADGLNDPLGWRYIVDAFQKCGVTAGDIVDVVNDIFTWMEDKRYFVPDLLVWTHIVLLWFADELNIPGTHTCIHTCIHAYIHAHITHMHMRIHAYTHT